MVDGAGRTLLPRPLALLALLALPSPFRAGSRLLHWSEPRYTVAQQTQEQETPS